MQHTIASHVSNIAIKIHLVAQLIEPRRYSKSIQFRLEDGTGDESNGVCIGNIAAVIFAKRKENGEQTLELPLTQPQCRKEGTVGAEDLEEILGCRCVRSSQSNQVTRTFVSRNLDYVCVSADIAFDELYGRSKLFVRHMRRVTNPHEIFYHQISVAFLFCEKRKRLPVRYHANSYML